MLADDGHCTLREAVLAANGDAASGATAGECRAGQGDDTIRFAVAHPTLRRPGAGEDAGATGDLDLTSALLRDAPGRIRTCDLLLRRQALYPLSYGRGSRAA